MRPSRTWGTRARATAGKVGAERSDGLWPGDFFGILHCVQDDVQTFNTKGIHSRQPKGKAKAESVFEITIFSDGLGERFARGANTLPFALPPQRAKTARRGPRRLRRMGHPAF